MTRVAVIGAGPMGRHHVRLYREIDGVELVGVADANEKTASQVARQFSTRAYTDFRELLTRERPEAVTVAVPTQAHLSVVSSALAFGCHVLVEKPMASSVDEAAQLVAAADRADRVLAVGHVERFNPAVIELKRRLDAGELGRVFQIHTRRLGPFPARVRDVGVVVDLATHDLDIMRYLTGSEAERVFAETRREIHSSNEDLVSGLIRFADNTLGLVEINWLTPTKVRELWVTGERGLFLANYLTQDLYFYENAEVSGLAYNALAMLRGVSEGAMTRYALQRVEPLRAEQEAFLRAVRGEPSRIVSGADGRAALALALALVDSARMHESIELGQRVAVRSEQFERV